MADAGCRSALHAHAHRLARAASRRLSIGQRSSVHLGGVSGPRAPRPSDACQGTDDAPYRALHRGSPGAPARTGAAQAAPLSSRPGQVGSGILAKATGLAAAASATGAGAALAYRTLAGMPAGVATQSTWPDMSQQSAISYVPSLALAPPGEGNAPQGVSLVPSVVVSGADVPAAVPEPSGALIVAPVLLAFVLVRRAAIRRRQIRSQE